MHKNLLSTPTGYYFRMRVPKRHRDYFKRLEFKKALGTFDSWDAQKKAVFLAATIDNFVAELDKQLGYRMRSLPFFTNIMLTDVNVGSHGVRIAQTDSVNSNEDTVFACRQMLGLPAAEHLPTNTSKALAVSGTQNAGAQVIDAEQLPTRLFSTLIEDFTWEKITSGKWKREAGNGRKEQLLLGIEFFGDVDVTTINRDKARDYVATLEQLPPNRKKIEEYKGLSIIEIAEKNADGPKLSAKSINMTLTDTAAFFKWCVRCGYADRNPFEGLSVKESSSAITQRLPYSPEDLKCVFGHSYFQHHNCEPSEYFLPLLGLYHGARLNELCQLHTSDVYELEEGFWVIDINDNDEQKSIKTVDSRRILPVHPELIRANFIAYVQNLKPGRVFPNLEYKRGKFSGDYSKRYGTLRRRVKVQDKDFHSFRHLVSSELEKLGIEEHLVASILGHQHPQITFGRYGEPKHIRRMHQILSLLKYDVSVVPWPVPRW